MKDRPKGFGIRAPLSPHFQRGAALRWVRAEDGALYTNVNWIVRHHSPDGFEIGYPGSGPADLALNAMAELFPVLAVPDGAQRVEKCFDGKVSHTAWMLHQPFKFRFLANADRRQGCVEWADIWLWIEAEPKRKSHEPAEQGVN